MNHCSVQFIIFCKFQSPVKSGRCFSISYGKKEDVKNDHAYCCSTVPASSQAGVNISSSADEIKGDNHEHTQFLANDSFENTDLFENHLDVFSMLDETVLDDTPQDVDTVSVVSQPDSDADYVPSVHSDSTNDEETEEITDYVDEQKLFVFESSLMQLFRHCPTCGLSCNVEKTFLTGSMFSVKYNCVGGHSDIWRSQPLLHKKPAGNLLLAAGYLYTGGSYSKIANFAKSVNLAFPSRTIVQKEQKQVLFPVVQEAWEKEKQKVYEEIKASPKVVLSGDARCDSPGHCAKFGSYTLMDTSSNKIVDMELVQVSEVRFSDIFIPTGQRPKGA